MQCTRILLVRHAETAWNAEGRMQGHLDIPLNATGLAQAQRVADALVASEVVHAVFSSDLVRVSETARPFAQRSGMPLSLLQGLRERHLGVFQGCTLAEVRSQWPVDADRWYSRDPDWAPPEGGETLRQFRQRINAVIIELATRHLGQCVAVFTHGGALDIIYRLATDQGWQAPRTWALANAAINRLMWTPDTGLRLVGWGDTTHLQADALDERST